MSMQHYRLDQDFQATDVVDWYTRAAPGDIAVIALPQRPSVQLHRCANGYVFWCTEGSRGLTVTLDDATQRLAMLQSKWSMPLQP